MVNTQEVERLIQGIKLDLSDPGDDDLLEVSRSRLEATIRALRSELEELEADEEQASKLLLVEHEARLKAKAALSVMQAELRLRKRFMDRLPICPDHRDKVAGKPCVVCEGERKDAALRDLDPDQLRHWSHVVERGSYRSPNDLDDAFKLTDWLRKMTAIARRALAAEPGREGAVVHAKELIVAQACDECGASCRCEFDGPLMLSSGCCVHGEADCEPGHEGGDDAK